MDDWRTRNRSLSPVVYDHRGMAVRRGPPHPARYQSPPRRVKMKDPLSSDRPVPEYVVKAYYRNVPTKIASPDNMNTDEDFKRAYTQGRNREKPSRVEISSQTVVDELQEISGLSLEDDPFMYVNFSSSVHFTHLHL
jgi:hypothetical protein